MTSTRTHASRTESREPHVQLPDSATKLVVRIAEGGDRVAMVIGPRTRASYHASKRPVSCVELRLRPGLTRPLLGTPALDLVGRAILLDDFSTPVAHRLADELRSVEPESIALRLAEVLPAHLTPAVDDRTALLRAAVRALSTGTGHLPGGVRELARRLAVSERQLRNLFAEGVGVSPKHYARIARVRHILAHRSPAVPWAEVAAATGYYDQSHMTADFRTLMGVPPTSYFTGRLPAAQPCQAFTRP
ncbi:AraC family transcriptional regulator [Streptomyces capitiformicae]|uniref:AraC family transcriptional regulator n=1 Tax=Streptomyces capitiformicae TaxID=2014920 RepID=UPI001E4CEC12|nr:helix-turn-helix domain-containing protein [Streptomyces capitiformicae]